MAIAIVIGPAQAATSTKFYSASVAPTTAAKGSTSTYTFTLTNELTSTQTLGSANFSIPTLNGFSVVAPGVTGMTTPAGKSDWTVTPTATALEFRSAKGSELGPGESVSAAVTVKTECWATDGTWTTIAKQANNFSGQPGNNFARVGSDPVLQAAAGGGTPAALAFVQQPTDSLTNQAISPAVTVKAVDSCGNVATGAAGNVSMAIGTDGSGSGATLSGTLSQPFVNGVATFGDLSINLSGTDYTLAATSGTLTSATSTQFDVLDQLCSDPSDGEDNTPDVPCVASNGITTVSTPSPPDGATMKLSLSVTGKSFACDGSTSSGGTVGSLAAIVPSGYTAPYTATLSYDKSVAPGTGVANFRVCLDQLKGDGFEELDSCKNNNPNPPCILSRNRTGVGDLVIVLFLDPADPYGGTDFG